MSKNRLSFLLNKRVLFLLLVPLLIGGVLLIYYLLSRPDQTKQSVVTAPPKTATESATLVSDVQINPKERYKNPFDEENYINPFSAVKNPFDNLR